jgi:hypothetical protein
MPWTAFRPDAAGRRLAEALAHVPLIELHGPWARAVAFQHLRAAPSGHPPESPVQPLWPGSATLRGARFTPKGGFGSVYLSGDAVTALAEVEGVFLHRQLRPVLVPCRQVWLVIRVEGLLTRVLNLADPKVQTLLGSSPAELTGPWLGMDRPPTQRLGQAADTVSTVMRDCRKKASPKPSSAAAMAHNLAASPSGLVNNLDACQKATGSFASRPARSPSGRSPRASKRLPAGGQAPVPRSERTPSREDPVSARPRTGAPAAAAPKRPPIPHRNAAMSLPAPTTHFAGFDGAKQQHHVVIVNGAGQIVAEFRFAPTTEGWQQWRAQAARVAPLAVAIETSQGIVVDQLLQTPECTVYPLNPKAARAYRERKARERRQKRPPGCLELCRRAAAGRVNLEAAFPARPPFGTVAAAVPRRTGLD